MTSFLWPLSIMAISGALSHTVLEYQKREQLGLKPVRICTKYKKKREIKQLILSYPEVMFPAKGEVCYEVWRGR